MQHVRFHEKAPVGYAIRRPAFPAVPTLSVPRGRFRLIASLFLGLLLLLSHIGLAAERDDEEKKEKETGIRYDVKIEGVSDKGLRKELDGVLDTKTYKDRPPASLVLLERRAEEDIGHLHDALRSLGYYDHEVSYAIGEEKGHALVTFQVRPGKEYRFGDIMVTGEPAVLAGTPDHPIGTCMVSSEGACAAYFNYGRHAGRRRRETAPTPS
jgi:hypothetical protein